MEKKKILLDNNTIDLVCEHFEFFKSIKDRYAFYITANTIEEFANMYVPNFKNLKSDDEIVRKRAIELCENRHNKFKRNLILLAQLEPTFILESVCALGYSRLTCSCLGNGKIYKLISSYSDPSIRDAILADTAINNNCTLLLDGDTHLYDAMKENSLPVMNFNDLKKEVEGSK